MIGIVDYGMGNLLSVRNAVEAVGYNAKVTADPSDLQEAERLILPGVGAFRDCMKSLHATGLVDVLQALVVDQGRPILGICLGMQAMASKSFEGGEFQGLGWFEAEVVRIRPNDASLQVPQIGWNQVEPRAVSPLLAGITPGSDFYFVHSYSMKCAHAQDVIATCDYGCEVTAIVGRDNILATQFHPEKSQEHGLRVLSNFLSWNP
jgi:glutamine amidotransferase